MKILAAPPTPDFKSYISRPETVFVERESEPLEELYTKGYLPYSSSKGVQGVWYSARSARVVLSELKITSENRRIAKKFDGQFTKQRIALSDFNITEEFMLFCLEYFLSRHGEHVMPRERLELILNSGLVSHVVRYTSGEKIVAYVLEVQSGSMAHYWYSFFDLSLAHQSLGLWLMLDCIRDARENGTAYYYLGTVYGHKALYKTNFEPLEWWDRSEWSPDVKKLKELSRTE